VASFRPHATVFQGQLVAPWLFGYGDFINHEGHPMSNQHPENSTRAQRINPALLETDCYSELVRDIHQAEDDKRDEEVKLLVAAVLSDLRHLCDFYGTTFFEADRLAYGYYLKELHSPTL
jgi:hypothetical protein